MLINYTPGSINNKMNHGERREGAELHLDIIIYMKRFTKKIVTG